MIPVFSAAEMRACDECAVRDFGISGLILMENAARGAADIASDMLQGCVGRHVVIICGRGNNGGDGFAIARHLHNRGATVHVVNVGPDEASHGDAATNLAVLRRMEDGDTLRVTLLSDVRELRAELEQRADLVIDAFLGTGLHSPLHGEAVDIVQTINGSGIPILAVDIPSGINSDTGFEMGAAVRASRTATMGSVKRGLLFKQGRECSGRVEVVDITVPRSVLHDGTATFALDDEDILNWLPRRGFDVHKYQMGKVFVLAGSVGLTGAATMTAEAALRSGAGIVKLGVPESLNSIFEVKLTEIMTMPLKETAESTLSLNGYDRIMDLIESSTVSVVGPGISRQYETQNLVRRILQHATRPMVVDADALFALSGHLDILQTVNCPLILTPHHGEFSRLVDQSIDDIDEKRIELARIFAMEFGCTLVLKGAPTVIAVPEGVVYVNTTGNPGMATAGSGDVLAGIIAGLCAQGLSPERAALCGVFLHGKAGDRAVQRMGLYGMIASDMLQSLAETMKEMHDRIYIQV